MVLMDWREEDAWDEVGEDGEQRLSHCSSMVGAGAWEWVGEEATGGGCH